MLELINQPNSRSLEKGITSAQQFVHMHLLLTYTAPLNIYDR